MSAAAAVATAVCCGLFTLATAATLVTGGGSLPSTVPSSVASTTSTGGRTKRHHHSAGLVGVKSVRVRRYHQPLAARNRPRHLPRLPSRPRPPLSTPPVIRQPQTPDAADVKPPWVLRPPPLKALSPPSSFDKALSTPPSAVSSPLTDRGSSTSSKPPSPAQASLAYNSPMVELVLECGRRRRRKTATAGPRKAPTMAWRTPPPSGEGSHELFQRGKTRVTLPPSGEDSHQFFSGVRPE